eukprot:scaffold8529_cov137-Cylindrotheca_fusiformis.AAC.1
MASQEQQEEGNASSSTSYITRSAITEEIRTRLHALSTERSIPPLWETVELAHTVDPHLLLSRIRHDLKRLIVPEGSDLQIEDPILQTLQENNTVLQWLQALSLLGWTISSREELDTIENFYNAIQILKTQIDELRTTALLSISTKPHRSSAVCDLDHSIMDLEFLVLKLDENRTRWNEVESKNIVWELKRLVGNCKKMKQEVRLLETLDETIAVDFDLNEIKAIMETLPDDHESIPSVMEAIESMERMGTLLDRFSQCGAEAFAFQRIKDMNVNTSMVTRVGNALRDTGIASFLARMSAKAVLEQNGLRVVVRVLQGYLRSEEDMHFLECCITIIRSVVREGEEGAIAFTSIVGALEAVTAAGAKDCTSPMQDPHQPFQESHKVARQVVDLLSMIAEYETCKAALATYDCISFLDSVVNQCRPIVDFEQSARTCLAVLLQYQHPP